MPVQDLKGTPGPNQSDAKWVNQRNTQFIPRMVSVCNLLGGLIPLLTDQQQVHLWSGWNLFRSLCSSWVSLPALPMFEHVHKVDDRRAWACGQE